MGSNMSYKRNRVPDHGHGAGSLMSQGASGEPLFLASPAAQINSSDLTDIKNLSGTNTGDQDLSPYIEGPSSSVDGQEMIYDGTTGKKAKTGLVRSVKSSATTIPAGTSWTDGGMSFAVEEGGVYWFRFLVRAKGGPSSDSKRLYLSVDGPASPDFLRYAAFASSSTVMENDALYTYNQGQCFILYQSGTNLHGFGIVEGFIAASADGTVNLSVRHSYTDHTSEVMAGSFVEYLKV